MRQKRLVEQLLTQDTLLPPLPVPLAEELTAFAQLSTEVLWILLANLNRKAQQAEGLTVVEQQRQIEFLALYQNSMVRRAKALDLLQQRGHVLHHSLPFRRHE